MTRFTCRIAVTCVFCGALGLLPVGRQSSSPLVAAAPTQTADDADAALTIAALGFHHGSADPRYAPLAEAIGDLLMAQLSAAGDLAFVERARIDAVLKEQTLSANAAADQVRLGQLVGARFVLTGSVSGAGSELVINAHLIEVATTRVARSVKVQTSTDRLVQPVDKLARELADELNLKLPELTEDQIDKSPEANLHFMRGLGYHFAGMPEHAGTQFMKALAIDPEHARARFFNGMSYFDQQEFGHAKIEFARFVKRFGDHDLFPRAKRLLEQCRAEVPDSREGDTP